MSRPGVNLAVVSEALTPRVRRALYFVYAGAWVFLGAVQAFIAGADLSTPAWLEGANEVLGYLGIPVATLAGVYAGSVSATTESPAAVGEVLVKPAPEDPDLGGGA